MVPSSFWLLKPLKKYLPTSHNITPPPGTEEDEDRSGGDDILPGTRPHGFQTGLSYRQRWNYTDPLRRACAKPEIVLGMVGMLAMLQEAKQMRNQPSSWPTTNRNRVIL